MGSLSAKTERNESYIKLHNAPGTPEGTKLIVLAVFNVLKVKEETP